MPDGYARSAVSLYVVSRGVVTATGIRYCQSNSSHRIFRVDYLDLWWESVVTQAAGQLAELAPTKKSLTCLDVAALALLAERDMHPYEMFQLIRERREDRIVKARPGTLYHAMGRLAASGLVAATGTERAGNRPERTVYSLTGRGWAALQNRIREILATPVREYPAFPVALAESHNLPQTEVVALLRQRITLLDQDIGEVARLSAWARDREIPKVYWIGLEHSRTVLAAEADWLRTLVADIDSGELPWIYCGARRDQHTTEVKDS